MSGIFSKACFEEWLSSRQRSKIVYPEDSFKRVLYAVIRGADNRKPFPENVETKLLKILKEEGEKLWGNLFPEMKGKFGARGVKKVSIRSLNY